MATISLNPSSLEFYHLDDRTKDKSERLPMVEDFGVQDRKALTDEGLRRARAVRDQYFGNKPHTWFTPMQMMLRAMSLGWSYAEGTAVQVDVVACATRPSYGDVPEPAKKAMIQNCRPHLQQTLSRFSDGTMLIVNGSGAFEAVPEMPLNWNRTILQSHCLLRDKQRFTPERSLCKESGFGILVGVPICIAIRSAWRERLLIIGTAYRRRGKRWTIHAFRQRIELRHLDSILS